MKPGEWTKFKLVVSGRTARLYLNGSFEPTLISDDLRNAPMRGSVGLWLGPMTEASTSDHPRLAQTSPDGNRRSGEWAVKLNESRSVQRR